MKISKNILSALMMIAIASSVAVAQTAGTGTAAANATVVAAMTVTPTAMEFGELVSNQTKTIAADSSAAAKFEVTGAATSASVNFNIAFPASLTGPGTDMTTSAFGARYNLTADNNAAATAFSGSTATINQDITTDGTSTSFWVYSGMAVTAGAAQTAGSYTGNIVLTLAYN